MYMHIAYLHIRIIYIYCSQSGCQRWGVHVCSSGGAQAELRPVQFASRPLGEWKLAAYVSHEPICMVFMAHIPIGKSSTQWHCECHVNLDPHPLETSGILPWAEVKTTISWHVRWAPAARVSFHRTEAQNCVLQVGWAPAILVDWSLSFVFWS